MLEKKQNVFDDFIAAAEYLIEHKYTKPERYLSVLLSDEIYTIS